MHKLAISCCLPYLVSHKVGSQWHGKVFNVQSQQSQELPLTEIMNFKKINYFTEFPFICRSNLAAQESCTTHLTPSKPLMAAAPPPPPSPHSEGYLTVLEVML